MSFKTTTDAPTPSNGLEFVRACGTTIASDGAEYLKIAEFSPIDATSNPSLIYSALCHKPEYAHILNDAVRFAYSQLPAGTLEERVELALDRALLEIGLQIQRIIPGRVSLSLDPRLGTAPASVLVDRSLKLVALFDSITGFRSGSSSATNALHPLSTNPTLIPQSRRILLKIPATPTGILAAYILETQHGILTNLTLVFSPIQALACAQAGVSVISPFIGRVKDWHVAQRSAGANARQDEEELVDLDKVENHPGILLVRQIRTLYSQYGYNKTEVMAAGFRHTDEILEVVRGLNLASTSNPTGSDGGFKGLGPHLVTLPPDLLDGLRRRSDVPAFGSESPLPVVRLPSYLFSSPSSSPSSSSSSLSSSPSSSLSPSPSPSPAPSSQYQLRPKTYFSPSPSTPSLAQTTDAYIADIKLERIALDKVPEGLAKFSVDAEKLEDAVRAALIRLESGVTSGGAVGGISKKRETEGGLELVQRKTHQRVGSTSSCHEQQQQRAAVEVK